jgi:hypothetical protein
MALVRGVNFGLCTVQPSGDPAASPLQQDNLANAVRVTATEDGTITEVGWYCSVGTGQASFAVALYDDNSNKPGNLLQVSDTGTKDGGADAWYRVSGLNWPISNGVTYWIAIQMDDASGTVYSDGNTDGAERYSVDNSATTYPNDPWVESSAYGRSMAIYGLYTTAGPVTNTGFLQLL